MTYYVLSGFNSYNNEITEHKNLEHAKKEFEERVRYSSDVRIAKGLQVTIEVVDDPTELEAKL
jgi:hypothetical protein